MPAKATIYNLKCEPVFDFGTGPRNLAFYNPQGTNILCIVDSPMYIQSQVCVLSYVCVFVIKLYVTSIITIVCVMREIMAWWFRYVQ